MRIELTQGPEYTETEILIRCPQVDEDILRIVSLLRISEQKITGLKDGEICLLDAKDILYIDTADRRTFCYTDGAVYESALRLYELEEKLSGMDFFRTGKSGIVNFLRVRSIRPDFGGRLLLTLDNGEQVPVSRQYAAAIKHKLEALERRRKP